MTTDAPASSTAPHGTPPRRPRSRVPLMIVVLLVLLAGAVGAAVEYFVVYRGTVEASKQQTHDNLMQMTGLSHPVQNKLDARFADADGDLVADPPTDAGKLVDPPKLFFSYVAVEDPSQYEKDWQPFCDHLSKVTGKAVEYLPVKHVEDQLKALRDGQLHVTGFNSGAIPTAVDSCGFVPVCRVDTGDPKGTHIEIIVPADSAIQSLSDLKDHELTLTEPTSNSGFKAPLVLLRANQHLEPEKDYSTRESGGHEASILGVASKQYQAAAVAWDILARLEANGQIKKSDYRSIYKSESFPSAGLGYAYNLKPELAAKIKEALLTFDLKGTPLEQELGWTGRTKFLPVNYKDDWSLIRRIDDDSGHSHELKQ
jgi:phosphonate transport system substrate-binding protein